MPIPFPHAENPRGSRTHPTGRHPPRAVIPTEAKGEMEESPPRPSASHRTPRRPSVPDRLLLSRSESRAGTHDLRQDSHCSHQRPVSQYAQMRAGTRGASRDALPRRLEETMRTQMEDFLRACRFHHRTLIVVSVTALLFAATPSEKQRLEEAIQEAEFLSTVDFVDVYERAVRDHEEAGTYIKKIEALLQEARIDWARPAHQALFSSGNLPLPEESARIGELQRYILEMVPTVLMVWQVDDSALRKIGQELAKIGPREEGLFHLWYSRDGQEATAVLQWKGGFEHRCELDTPLHYKKTEFHFDPLEVIRNHPQNKRLIQIRRSQRPVVFPHLQRFWAEIRDMAPRRAASYLTQRKALSRNSIAFLGLSVPAQLAGIAIPLTTFLLALHLYLYMRRLNGMLRSVAPSQTDPRCFAWLPLFPDRASRTLSVISWLLAPTIANISILCRSWHTGMLTILVAMLFTFATAVFTIDSYCLLPSSIAFIPKLWAKVRGRLPRRRPETPNL